MSPIQTDFVFCTSSRSHYLVEFRSFAIFILSALLLLITYSPSTAALSEHYSHSCRLLKYQCGLLPIKAACDWLPHVNCVTSQPTTGCLISLAHTRF